MDYKNTIITPKTSFRRSPERGRIISLEVSIWN